MRFPVDPVGFDELYYQGVSSHVELLKREPDHEVMKIRQAHLAFLHGDDARAADLLASASGGLKVGLESLLMYARDKYCRLPDLVTPAIDLYDVEGAMYGLYARSMQCSDLAKREEALVHAKDALLLAGVLGLKNRIIMFETWIQSLLDFPVTLESANPALREWAVRADVNRLLDLGRYSELSRDQRQYPEHDIALAFMHYDSSSDFGQAYVKLLAGRYEDVFEYDLARYAEHGVFLKLFAELRLGKIKSNKEFLAMLTPAHDSEVLRSILFFVYDIINAQDSSASLLEFQRLVEKLDFREDIFSVARDLAPVELTFAKFCFDSVFYQQLFYSIPLAYRDGILFQGNILEERSVVPSYLTGIASKPHRNTMSRFRSRLEAHGIRMDRMVSVQSIAVLAERSRNEQLKEYLRKTFRYNPG